MQRENVGDISGRTRAVTGRQAAAGQAWSRRAGFAFLLASLLIGGAGSGYPLLALALQLMAIAVICLQGMHAARTAQPWQMALALGLWALVLVALAVQLVPLPWSVWTTTPGREVAARIYHLLGWQGHWHALSLTPDNTRRMLFDLLPPLAGLLVMATAPLAHRRLLLRTLVLVACASTALSALQLAGGPELAPVLYQTAHRGFGVGLFVNRNHQAAFLLVAMVLTLLPGVIAPDRDGRPGLRRARWPIAVAIWSFLALGLIATGSRTGLVLLPVAALSGIVSAVPPGSDRRRWLAGAALAALAAFLLSWTPLVQGLLARFSTVAEDERYNYWDNTVFALRQFWPLGSGAGSFTTIYPTVEPLDQVSVRTVNHAHSDLLEVLLEGGLGFAMVLGIVVAGLVWLGVSRARRDRETGTGGTALAAGTCLALLAACSLVDYPLRMSALAVVLALLAGLLVPEPARTTRPAPTPSLRRKLVTGIGTALALVLGWQAAAAGAGTVLVSGGRPETAVALAPWSAGGWNALAEKHYFDGDAAAAVDAALQALAIRPIDPVAVRTLGLARIAQHRQAPGQALLETGARLGWRDGPNQLWLIQRAAEAGAPDVAVQRIDALLRQGKLAPELFPFLRTLALAPQSQPEVVRQLGQYPSWRQGFFNDLSTVTATYPGQVVALLDALRRAGTGATPGETALARWQLQVAGDAGALRAVWNASDVGHLLGDGGFDSPSGLVGPQAPPYVWQAPALPGTSVVIAMPDAPLAGQAATITADGAVAGPVLQQTLALAPGFYRLSSNVLLSQDADRDVVNWSVRCGERVFPVAVAWSQAAGSWSAARGSFRIEPDCPLQTLVFGLLKSSGAPIRVSLDQVRIDSAPPGKAGR